MSAPKWTQTPPEKQGTYWHWSGNEDSAPVPVHVLWSGFSGKCFVSQGQLGLEQAIDCDEFGGWWLSLPTPPTPGQSRPKPCLGYAFDGGGLVLFDEARQQMPELNGGWPVLWAKHAEALGYDPDGVVFELSSPKSIKIVRSSDGEWNWEYK